jgi:adenylate cyclase
MSKNHLTQFTVACDRCMLTDLNLANCKLPSLPDDLYIHLPALESLVLDSNTLTVLPNSITLLSKLQRLSVQSNNLEILPCDISKLTELRTLDVQNNNLKALPKDIWLCVSLCVLNCSSNLLEVFPEPFIGTSSLGTPSSSTPPIVFHNGQGTAPPTPSNEYLPTHPCDTSNIPPTLSPNGFQSATNFNPPSFFDNPRNHPPPLSLTLRFLYLGDNRFTDDIWSPLSLFSELRTLNLCFNDLYEIPPDGLCHLQLYELYLSGNHLASLPADDIEKLAYLRVLAVNGNKLQTLPAEIGKLRKLLVLDVGNNFLKYNISNWPYDWNW